MHITRKCCYYKNCAFCTTQLFYISQELKRLIYYMFKILDFSTCFKVVYKNV